MKTVTNIAISNDKKNKTRSTLIMISIALTTMLLTIISLFASGIIRFNKKNADKESGRFYGSYIGVNSEQLQEVKRHSEFTDVGLSACAGTIDSDYLASIMWLDNTSLQLTNTDKSIVSGKYPEKENEIAAKPSFLQSMGYDNVKVGDTVVLPFRSGLSDKYEDIEFVVSGLINDDKSLDITKKSYTVYCSEKFYCECQGEEDRVYTVFFRLNDSVKITIDDAEDTLIKLAEKCGIENTQVSANTHYLMWELDPGTETIATCAVIAMFVILFSIVVIYNIFQVGIVEKVQEYGKIKALGATKKQMRKLIFTEGIFLAVSSIPIGLILGYVVTLISFNWLVESSNKLSNNMENVRVFSLPMIALSTVISFVTVVLALIKPMRIVSKVSPVEAIRYSSNNKKNGGGQRKGKKNVSVFSMAIANICGNSKGTISTIFTMGLSCVLFVVVANSVGNIDEKYEIRNTINHGQFQLSLDYSMSDKAYPENNLDSILQNNPLNQDIINDIKEIPQVTSVETRNIMLMERDGQLEDVAIYSREDFDKFCNKKEKNVGNCSISEAEQEGSIYYCWSAFMESSGISLNSNISANLIDQSKELPGNFKVTGAFGSGNTSWIMTEAAYNKLNLSCDSIGYIWIDCKKEDVKDVQKQIESIIQGVDHIQLSTYEDASKTISYSVSFIKIGCYLFLGIIGVIGFMNLANTMIISIITKKHEYGILQAIGMTNRQLNRSLQIQGLIFSVGTVVVALIVGLPLGYKIFLYSKKIGTFGLNVYHIPFVEIVAMIVIIMSLQLALSVILSRNIKKESLVERIRYQG